jgi:hypothetical protein
MFSKEQIAKLADLKGRASAQQAIPYISGMDLGDFEVAHAEIDCPLPYPVKEVRQFILYAQDHLETEYGVFLLAMPGSTREKALTHLMHIAIPSTKPRSFSEVRREVLSYRVEHLNRIVTYVESLL